MIKVLLGLLMTGQLMAAKTILASPEKYIESAFYDYYGDKARLSSLHIHERVISPFSDCQELAAVLTPGRQRMSRPRVEVTCRESGLSRRIMTKAEGEFKALAPTRDVRRGRVLMGDDLQESWIDFSYHRDDVLLNKADAYGREVNIPLREGKPLRDSQLRVKYDIFSGQIAELVVNRQGIFFSIPVKALESGIFGDRISVENSASGKTFEATIARDGSLTLESIQ